MYILRRVLHRYLYIIYDTYYIYIYIHTYIYIYICMYMYVYSIELWTSGKENGGFFYFIMITILRW